MGSLGDLLEEEEEEVCPPLSSWLAVNKREREERSVNPCPIPGDDTEGDSEIGIALFGHTHT